MPERWLLRPSVSLVPLTGDIYEFFQSSTRRIRRLRISNPLVNALKLLDGTRNIQEIAVGSSLHVSRIGDFIDFLHRNSLVETYTIRTLIDNSKWRRTLNFMGDYFPSDELMDAFARIQEARVLILGLGAVGGWIATQLAQSGIRKFLLLDDDVVDESNLNRSVYGPMDVNKFKAECLAERLGRIDRDIDIEYRLMKATGEADLHTLFGEHHVDVVVNAADFPSVDLTSDWVDAGCQKAKIPYVIAGGYNLHLSLVGLSVIPGLTACYRCSQLSLNEHADHSLEGVRRLWRPKRNLGSLSPLTAITSAFGASETLRLVLSSERLRPAMVNRRGEFNFLTSNIEFVDLPPRKECLCKAYDYALSGLVLS